VEHCSPCYSANGNRLGTQRANRTECDEIAQTPATITLNSAYSYNAADWLTSATDKGLTTSYAYDAAGQQIGTTTSDGQTGTTLAYDAAGRVSSIAENAGGAGPYTTAYTYNQNDLPLTLAYPTGVTETAQYDANSALTQLAMHGPQVGPTQTLTTTDAYGYNAASWITSTTTLKASGASHTVIEHLEKQLQNIEYAESAAAAIIFGAKGMGIDTVNHCLSFPDDCRALTAGSGGTGGPAGPNIGATPPENTTVPLQQTSTAGATSGRVQLVVVLKQARRRRGW